MTKPSAPRPGCERAGRAHFPVVSEAQPATLPRRGVLCGHVVAAVGLLHRRMAETCTLGSLAAEVRLSRSLLVRALDTTAGMSPMAFLRQMRVQRMARLLRSTDLSVAASARAVGWTDPNYASHCFRTSCSVSATAFRCRRAARQGEPSEEIVALVAPSIGRYLA